MALTESEFERMAERLLARLAEAIEAPEADGLEVELQGPVLNIEVEGKGVFVVSKHAPTRQIWLSSPVSGASHYAFDGNAWRSTRDEAELLSRLAGDLARLTGVAFELA